MKRLICALLALMLLLSLCGCSTPDSLQLDLTQGFGLQTKLLHLNASTEKNRQRIEGFAALTQDAQPLDKDLSLFAYYPDLAMTITRDGEAGPTVIVDINGDHVDFYYSGETQLYRSKLSAMDLKELLHQSVR